MTLGATISNLPDFKADLQALAPALRRRPIRNALAAGGRVVRDEIRRNAPVLDIGNPGSAKAVRRGVRKPGTVRDAVRVRTSKLARRSGDVGVFVNVRPLKRGVGGANNPNDPFYWRWLNYGWTPRAARRGRAAASAGKRVQGLKFVESGASRLNEALAVVTSRMAPEIAKLNLRRTSL